MRIRIDFAYDGTGFCGWAAQPGLRSVEGELEQALRTILRSDVVRLTVAGRTDAGVHAAGAVAHADVDPHAFAALPGRSRRLPEEAAVTRLGGVLPDDIVVRAARPAPEGFDARFSAVERRYRYRICDDPRRMDPLRRRDTVVVRHRLDEAAMNRAVEPLLGLHDYAAFCKAREGATTIRTLLEYRWERVEDAVLVATVRADAFCHSMVRALVGAAIPVGEGRRPETFPTEVLAGRARDPRVGVAPAHGLTLAEVVYPPDDQLAARAEESRAVRELPAEGDERGNSRDETGPDAQTGASWDT